MRDSAVLALVANIASPSLCACGCQEIANPEVPFVRLLRQSGLTYSAIGQFLGCSRSYLSKLIRKPPRYVMGHSGRTLVWRRVSCQECNHSFMQCGPKQTYCQNSWCQQVRWFQERYPNDLPQIRERKRQQERRARQERTQRRIEHEDLMRERRYGRLEVGYGADSIYEPIRKYPDYKGDNKAPMTLADRLRAPLADPADRLVAQERASELRRVLGGIHDVEDWRKLDSETQSWYRAKLIQSGLLRPNA